MNKKQNSLLNNNQLYYEVYDEYKDSGIEWIGYIPKQWKIVRLKDEINIISSGIKSFEGIKEYLSTKSIDVNEIKSIDKIITNNNKPLRANMQPIYNSVWGAKMRFTNKCYLFNKKEEINKYILSTGFFGLISNLFNSNFLNYLIQSNMFIYNKDKVSYGSGQESINEDGLNYLNILKLDKTKQLAIVKFLDNKTNTIDKKISILERRNKLLIELEKSIINQAITKGINSFTKLDKQGNKIDFDNKLSKNDIDFEKYMNECEYKDSGIEWIGYIPNQWKIVRLKDEINIISSGIKSFEGIKEYLSTKSIDVNEIKSIDKIITNNNKPLRANMQPIYNSVWGAKMRFTNKCYLFNKKEEINKYILSTGFFGLISKLFNSNFLNYLIQSNMFIYNKDKVSYGSGQESINEDGLNYLNILKLSKKEQLTIVKFLDNKTNQFKQQKDSIKKEIEFLKEFKKSLINDVVTGKIKVIKD